MEYRVSPYGWICTFLEVKKRLSDEYQLDIKSPELINLIWQGFTPVEIKDEEERKKLQPKYNLIYSDVPRAGFWDMTVLDYSNSLPPGHTAKLRYVWHYNKQAY